MNWKHLCITASLLAAVVALPMHAVAESEVSSDLKGVFSAVLTQHPMLGAIKEDVKAKGFMGESARAGRYPSLTAQAGVQHKDKPTLTLRARQPIWAFGRIDSGIGYADADKLAAQATLLRTKRELLEESAVAYAQVLRQYQLQSIIEEDISKHDQFYQQIRRRELGQLASSADTRLAALRLSLSVVQKRRIDGDLLLAQNELESLTQKPVGKLQPVGKALTNFPVGEDEIETLALNNSAAIELNQRLLELAKADTKVEKTRSMPTVYLQAEKHVNQSGFADENKYSVIVDISLDGMGFIAGGKAKAAGAREIAARARLTDSRNELTRNVRSLLRDLRTQNDLIGVLDQSVAEYTGILDSYVRQYEAGRKAWLDVLNLLQEMTAQRLQLVQAESDKLIISLRINAILGSFD